MSFHFMLMSNRKNKKCDTLLIYDLKQPIKVGDLRSEPFRKAQLGGVK